MENRAKTPPNQPGKPFNLPDEVYFGWLETQARSPDGWGDELDELLEGDA